MTASAGEVTRTATTVTGERAGTVVLPDLPVPASYTVTVSGAGYATQTRQVDLGPEGVEPLDIVMTSVGGVVEGTVTETGGGGLAGAGLTLDGPTGTYKTMASSDGSGTFRLSGIDPGQYVLTATVFGHEPGSAQVTVTSGSTSRADLVLAPIPGDGLVATSRIRGSVRDASTGGQITCPHLRDDDVGGCVITVAGDVADSSGAVTRFTATVGPDEEYTFPKPGDPGLLPGLYRLTISAPGYEDGHVNVTVPMGQVVEATTVALEQSPSIVGTIQARVGAVSDGHVRDRGADDARGRRADRPVHPRRRPGVRDHGRGVQLHRHQRVVRDQPPDRRPVHGVRGPAGRQRSTCRPSRAACRWSPGRRDGSTRVLDRLGRLNVTVMRADGSSAIVPAVGATVTTAPASVLPVTTPVTDVNGLTQVIGLAQGDYQVTASGHQHRHAAQSP